MNKTIVMEFSSQVWPSLRMIKMGWFIVTLTRCLMKITCLVIRFSKTVWSNCQKVTSFYSQYIISNVQILSQVILPSQMLSQVVFFTPGINFKWQESKGKNIQNKKLHNIYYFNLHFGTACQNFICHLAVKKKYLTTYILT